MFIFLDAAKVLKILPALFYFSFSANAPERHGVPPDIKISGGLNDSTYHAEWETNRTDGRRNYGLDISKNFELDDDLILTFEDFKQTSRSIDVQKIMLRIPLLENFGVGGMENLDYWDDPETRILFYYEYNGFLARSELNFYGLKSTTFSFKRTLWRSRNGVFELGPVASYRFEKPNEYWRMDLTLNVLPKNIFGFANGQ